MIDKVVRIRAQHGRFGIDHSELLNYEIDQTNKNRDEHMNSLVYMAEAKKRYPPQTKELSTILKERLHIQIDELNDSDEESVKKRVHFKENLTSAYDNQSKSVGEGTQERMTYKEWLKHKDAERRLKRKLISQAQNDVRTVLLEMATNEQAKHDAKIKLID